MAARRRPALAVGAVPVDGAIDPVAAYACKHGCRRRRDRLRLQVAALAWRQVSAVVERKNELQSARRRRCHDDKVTFRKTNSRAQSPSVAGCGSRVAFRKTSPRGSMPSVAGCGSRVAFRKTSPWGSMPRVAGCGSRVAFRNSGSASDPLRSRRHARKKRGRICKSFVFSNSALRNVRRRASGAAERGPRQATSRIFTAASRSTETSCETPRSAMVTP